jgi:subtilisin family serine protease
MKEYIVVAKNEAGIDSLHQDLTQDTTFAASINHTVIPDRVVDVANPRLANPRITHYYLTDTEADQLSQDPRIEAVHVPVPAAAKKPHVVQDPVAYNKIAGNFNRNSVSDQYNVNWGLRRTSLQTSEPRTGKSYTYDVNGAGVDVVVMDDGIQADHPEFLDATGTSRVQKIDWYAVTGIPGTMPSKHYDVSGIAEGEHGTHVATTIAGKTFGYAKNARVYSIRIFGNNNQVIPDTDMFDLVRVWHMKKPIDRVTGARRPTILNMSWGYVWRYDDYGSQNRITSINYRNSLNTYAPVVGRQQKYGQVGDFHGFNVPSTNAEAQDCENAGVVLVHSAGNFSHKIDVAGGPDYNNYYTINRPWAGGFLPTGSPVYYHRGSLQTTYLNTVSAVSDVSVLSGNALKDRVDSYSERGPGVTVCAPGTNITAGTSKRSSFPSNQYVWGTRNTKDTSHKVCKISGTSMAAPQVTGVLALFLSRNPTATPAQAQAWLNNLSVRGQLLTSTSTDDWNNQYALLGGPNKYLFNPYRAGYRDPRLG